jgi:broad specificity phosphatase PhoE
VIFVRHGRALADPDRPTDDWPLDPARLGEIDGLRTLLPDLPVICSDMRRAVETARRFAEPKIDPRLREITRPWTDELEGCIERYFRAEPIAGWEPPAAARARIQSVVADYGRAIYVSHGTVLTLYLAAAVLALDPMAFWSGLASPDAWELEGERLVHRT